MLNLKLREEFQGRHTPGTMISLRRDGEGATEIGPDYILSITYPTSDIHTALKNVSQSRAEKPVVLMGDRGRGKSHIMALIHHALANPERVQDWVQSWQSFADFPELRELDIENKYHPISEPLQNQEYPLLWELIFSKHPNGQHFRGKFEQTGHPYPARSLLEEMFERQPTALILDEFQKWFESLSDQAGTEGTKYRTWAENFIQNLSELAQERPDILILVTSVLNSNSEAFRQIHRVGPVLIDFSGPTARKDRQKLVLHRLFENRAQMDEASIKEVVSTYASERFRLRFSHQSTSEEPACHQEVVDCFPFSPELLDLLDNQILMAEAAQEARDLIRILAFVYSARGETVPVITPADFLVDDDSCGVQSLLTSIATAAEQERLREIAQRNLETLQETTEEEIPHAREIISTIWMRSMTPGRNPGGTPPEIQLDLTRHEPIDDNLFNNELNRIIENSINIHGEQSAEKRLRFGLEENPRSKGRATAKNSKLWDATAADQESGQNVFPGEDVEHIRSTLRDILVRDTRQDVSRVIVLGPDWWESPWKDVEEKDMPENWDQPVLLILPEALKVSASEKIKGLGEWLAAYVPRRRNTIRYLLPCSDVAGLYHDPDLLFLARCSYLCSIAWRDDAKYTVLKNEFVKSLRDSLKKRFDRFAILRSWNYRNPEECTFEIEKLDKPELTLCCAQHKVSSGTSWFRSAGE